MHGGGISSAAKATRLVVERLRLRGAARWCVLHMPTRARLQLARIQVRTGVVDGLVLVPEDALEARFAAALGLLDIEAHQAGSAYLEFGVYVGTSMACMARATARQALPDLPLVGFDSFQGMPEGRADGDLLMWQPGGLYSDMALTRANLARLGVPASRVRLIPGWFEDSLTPVTRSGLAISRAVVVMFDCVLESSTRIALEFCAPLIRDRAVFFFDDWSAADLAERGQGEAKAFGEWLDHHPEFQAELMPDLGYEEASAFLVRRQPTVPALPVTG